MCVDESIIERQFGWLPFAKLGARIVAILSACGQVAVLVPVVVLIDDSSLSCNCMISRFVVIGRTKNRRSSFLSLGSADA